MAIKNLLKKIYYSNYVKICYYLKIFPNYSIELKNAVGKCKSLLDVGCGSDSPIKSFSQKMYCVGVDAYGPSIEKNKNFKIHNKYYKISALDIGEKFKPNSFDCVLASDLIEHLTKEEGIKLIEMMEKIAKNKVIIMTPNGFLPQGIYYNNPWQVHKSGWTVKEMKKRGYKVIGIGGWKLLKGECARLRFWPKCFWLRISEITQFFVRNKPEKAFQILCVKTKGRS